MHFPKKKKRVIQHNLFYLTILISNGTNKTLELAMNHSSMHKLGTFLIATGANLVPCEIDFRNNNNNSK